jgi:uncharacterized protein (DUF952 family)
MSEPPQHLYKILSGGVSPPSPVPFELPLSPLDATDGFIHLSTAKQTPVAAELFFAQESSLFIGKIPLNRLNPNHVKWEVEHSPGCAHLYNGPKLGSAELVEIKKFERGDTDWGVVLANDCWLEQ